MRTPVRHLFVRLLPALGLAGALLLPALAAPSRAASPLVLRIGTLQSPDSINPWNASLMVEYEIFQIGYDLLVNFADDLSPIPGFAESWTQSPDGLTWTFKMRAGMKWSDGQPATSEDARWTIAYAIDAKKAGTTLGLGYIQDYSVDAGIDAVAAPDPLTLTIHTKYVTQRVLSMDAPILPKHVWEKQAAATVGDFTNPAPIVGSGPYHAVEWKTGQYIRFARNPNYWGNRGAADEIVIRFFPDAQDTMVQAFKRGELDYVRNPSAQQFDQLKAIPGVTAVEAPATGFTELGFNTYAKDIPGGGASTKALRDPVFRDALGYAIDKQALLDKVYHGKGTVGTTLVPPYYVQYHVEPDSPRVFDINLAKQKLDAAGYVLNSSGQRLDKEGKPLNLRLYFPNDDPSYATDAQFIADWFAQLGIKIKAQGLEAGTLTDIQTAPEYDPKANANYDLYIWGWVGDNNDPNTLLKIFLTSSIASAGTDSLYSNPQYDSLFKQQNEAPTSEARKAPIAEMQQLIYTQAPYHILTNDSELHVWRTDKFTNWQQMPPGTGTPFFVMGNLNYTLLTDATAPPTPGPTATPGPSQSAAPGASLTPAPAVTPAATPSPEPGPSNGTGSTLLLVGAVVLVALIAVGIVAWRGAASRRRREQDEE